MTAVDRDAGREGVGVVGWARLRGWPVDALQDAVNSWYIRTPAVKHRLLTDNPPVEPLFDVTTRNLVVDNFLEILARGVNPEVRYLALGDGTTTPQATNDALNNEVYRTGVGQDQQSGNDRLTSTFISQNEANGEAIREIGLTTGPAGGNWTLLTHLVLDPSDQVDEKTSNMAITIDYVLEFRRL